MVRTVGYGMEYGTVVWYVRCQVRYGAVVRYDGTVVQCIAPTVPLHRTTLVYPKIRCEKCKIGCQKCKIGCENWKIGCENFPDFGTLVGYSVPLRRTTVLYQRTDCTVPFFLLYRTSVPTVPYQCAHCTLAAYPLYRTVPLPYK